MNENVDDLSQPKLDTSHTVMASTGQDQYSDEFVTLICTEFNVTGSNENSDEIIISTVEISSWDLPSILAHKLLRIKSNPSRLIEESSYFRGLLSGGFSESRFSSTSVYWNLESFVSVLRVIYGCHVELSSYNFIPLNEAALFFGVDILLSKCRVWLDELTSFRRGQEPQLRLDSLIRIWKHGIEHANDFIVRLCTSYLARNFMWSLASNSYSDVPEKLLCSCIQHPDLTVDSEKHLCDAILLWISGKTAKSEGWSSNDLCEQICTGLLPLWFAAGKRRCRFFSKLADEATCAILSLTRHQCTSSSGISKGKGGNYSHLRIRLTKYTQKVDVSGFPQLTIGLMKQSSVNHANSVGDGFQISQTVEQELTFEAVQELDISNCPSLPLESAIDCFSKLFPSLTSLRAAYSLNFRTKRLCQLGQKLPLLSNLDLAMDISPIIPAHVSITASSSVLKRSTKSYDIYNCHSTVASSLSYISRPLALNITKLTLEGRTDISDSDLFAISEVCLYLCYVNIKGCTSVTDHGISAMILKCKSLHSVLACDTSFGNNSIMALCSGNSSGSQQSENHSQLMGYKLQTFHVGGCHGITENILPELLSGADHLRSLCLREIQVVDDALYRLSGSSLEMLDVSDTKVSSAALSHVIHRNPGLKSLKTRGCRHLLQLESKNNPEELYSVLGNLCLLEEIELGWGFSFISLGALKPAIRTLRTLVVGLGGSVGPDGLELLPTICPMLETLIFYFQVISDYAITSIIMNLHLRFLALCHCLGDISSVSFKFGMPNLRTLKLERVTPWMTNEDLANLADNCLNLVELSLLGCTLLDSAECLIPFIAFGNIVEAQAIISSGWPGLTSLHLEECGEITANGVTSILDCHALEDLLLRHTGPGISREFIIYAASKLPMLRKMALDICDARESDFDIPSFANKYFLSIVKIARCKLKKSALELHNFEARRTPVHRETLVLVWNSEKLARTVVKERL